MMQQQNQLLTDRKLARCAFPELPQRLSQRRSKSRTQPVNPRTFEVLEEWPNFSSQVATVSNQLDNIIPCKPDPALMWSEGLDAASDEIAVRGTLEQILFPQINYLARKLGITLRYKSGGSGRSFSFTDMVVLDISQGQQLNNLSARVFGNGEAKGNWQWELGLLSFVQALNSSDTKQKICIEVLQQLFGDMILDESVVGFISNYNETVFFYRESGRSKKLYYSPVVKITDAPVEKFLFVLEFVEQRKHLKPLLCRTLVKETPRNGYSLQLPQVQYVTPTGRLGKRKVNTIQVKAARKERRGNVAGSIIEFYNEDRLCDIPAYPLEDLHVTGNVLGMGKYGNVMEAELDGKKLALKTYDLRKGDLALQSYIKEQQVYHHLQSLQGKIIPSLLMVGRLPHTSVLYLGLTNEASKRHVKDLLLGKRAKEVGLAILAALDEIHNAGVLHGDISLSHVLITATECPKFIDFEYSVIDAAKADLDHETSMMEDLVLKEMEAT